LACFTEALELRKQLAADDPGDAQAQRQLASSFQKLGDVTFDLGNLPQGFALYAEAYPIVKKLAAADPTDVQAQTDVFICCWKQADVARRLGRRREALDWYGQGRAVLLPLHQAGKLHGQFTNAMAMVEHEIAECALVVRLTEDPAWPLVWGWPRF
jgi:tetratricopeptide (TPR) repeat protein